MRQDRRLAWSANTACGLLTLQRRRNGFRWACPNGTSNWRATTSQCNDQWLSVRLARTEATTVHEFHQPVAASVRASRTESCLSRVSEVAEPVVVPTGRARRKPKLDILRM